MLVKSLGACNYDGGIALSGGNEHRGSFRAQPIPKTEELIQRDFGSLNVRDPRSQIAELRADRFDRDCAAGNIFRRESFASDVINAPQRDAAS